MTDDKTKEKVQAILNLLDGLSYGETQDILFFLDKEIKSKSILNAGSSD